MHEKDPSVPAPIIVYVPTLGADEDDVPRAMRIFRSPANHYWEDTGIIGKHFQETLDIDVYAWDIWLIFPPGARWDGRLPPEPAFWMHQLGDLDAAERLDVEAFRNQVRRLNQDPS